MLVNFSQLENAPPPILVTLLGIIILVKYVQFKKAILLIVVTDSGIVTFVNL